MENSGGGGKGPDPRADRARRRAGRRAWLRSPMGLLTIIVLVILVIFWALRFWEGYRPFTGTG
jgi:hypothetical protein